jgi:hypothetical protein
MLLTVCVCVCWGPGGLMWNVTVPEVVCGACVVNSAGDRAL